MGRGLICVLDADSSAALLTLMFIGRPLSPLITYRRVTLRVLLNS